MTVCVRCERVVAPQRDFFTRIGRSAVVCEPCADGSHNGVVAPRADVEAGDGE